MSANKEATSSGPSGDAHEKSVDKLSVKEFCERFCIPNGVLVELTEGEAVSTEKAEGNAITFSKEQFNAGLRFPLPSLFKEFLHFTQIPPAFIHPNIVRVLMGCSILSMLYNLDLSLLEVLFVYSLKKGKNDIFSMAAHLPSLQLVTELPDSTKGGAKGHVLVRGAWAGLLEHPERPFSPNHSLVLPGKSACRVYPTFVLLFFLLGLSDGLIYLVADNAGSDKRGHVVEWVEKTFNLLAVVRESQAYVINILPRKLPKKVVPGEHYVLKDLLFYKEVKKADAQKRRALLDDREGRRKEGTLRKAPGKKRSAPSLPAGAPAKKKNKRKLVLNKGKEIKPPTPPKEFVIPPSIYVKEVTIRELEVPPLPSVSSGLGHLAAGERLALLAEETTSINQPGSPHPDADAAGASCAAASPLSEPPREEMGRKRPTTRRSHPARNLKSSLMGRLQDRFLETIEVSFSSVQDDHPEGSETEMAEQNPATPVLVPDGGAPGETQSAENEGAPDLRRSHFLTPHQGGVLMMWLASPLAFSYAELEEKLNEFHPLERCHAFKENVRSGGTV
ncbi:hypothetical protein AAG906_000143 [Vitis piasezkii]